MLDFLSNNWHGILSGVALLASVVAIVVHKVGGAAHKLVVDDIAQWLKDLDRHLNTQDIKTPPLPDSVRNPPT